MHRIVSSISRSSSKMRRIREEMAELSKKLSFLRRPSLRGDTGIFSKNFFVRVTHNIYKSTQFLTLIPNLILVLNQIEFSKRTSPEKGLEIHKNCIPRLNCLDMSQFTSSVGVSQIPGSVAI